MRGLPAILCATCLAWGCGSGGLATAPSGVPPAGEPRTPSPTPIAGTSIAIGQTVDARVELDAPHCFPDWDSLGRCRQFNLTADADATVTVTFAWARGAWDPDLFLVRPGGDWKWAGNDPSPRTAALAVTAGQTYRLVVMSSLPAVQEFTLAVDRQR